MKRLRLVGVIAVGAAASTAYACGTTSTGTEADAGVIDAALDSPLDLAVPPIALACPPLSPVSARTFSPPAPLHQGLCTDDITYSLIRCFVRNPAGRDCVGSTPREIAIDSACGRCIFTDVDASLSGPIIVDGRSARLNVGGCIQRVTGSIDAGCAGELTRFEECAMSACQHCYDEDASVAEAEACLSAARRGPCAPLSTGPECLNANVGDAASTCQIAGDFASRATALAILFCGTAPSLDASADALASDASGD